MKDMSQIELKFDSEQNAFGLTEDYEDKKKKKKAPGGGGGGGF